MPKPQQRTPHSNAHSRVQAKPNSQTTDLRLQRTAKKNPASGARACNLLGARANHLGAPHTHAQRASRPTDPGERAKRRRRARLMPSNVSGLPFCQARDQHRAIPSRPTGIAVLCVLYCAVMCVVALPKPIMSLNNYSTLQLSPLRGSRVLYC